MRRKNLMIISSLMLAFRPGLPAEAQVRPVAVPIPTAGISIVGNVVNIHDDWDNDMPVKEQETIRKSFSVNVPGSPNKLEVNNVFGPIKVTGIAGDQIQMVVTKT